MAKAMLYSLMLMSESTHKKKDAEASLLEKMVVLGQKHEIKTEDN